MGKRAWIHIQRGAIDWTVQTVILAFRGYRMENLNCHAHETNKLISSPPCFWSSVWKNSLNGAFRGPVWLWGHGWSLMGTPAACQKVRFTSNLFDGFGPEWTSTTPCVCIPTDIQTRGTFRDYSTGCITRYHCVSTCLSKVRYMQLLVVFVFCVCAFFKKKNRTTLQNSNCLLLEQLNFNSTCVFHFRSSFPCSSYSRPQSLTN